MAKQELVTKIDLKDYLLQETDGSFCTCCRKKMHLLAPRHPIPKAGFYYLCSHCGATAQAGVGPINGNLDLNEFEEEKKA